MTPHTRNFAVTILMSTRMAVLTFGDKDQTMIDQRPLLQQALAGAR